MFGLKQVRIVHWVLWVLVQHELTHTHSVDKETELSCQTMSPLCHCVQMVNGATCADVSFGQTKNTMNPSSIAAGKAEDSEWLWGVIYRLLLQTPFNCMKVRDTSFFGSVLKWSIYEQRERARASEGTYSHSHISIDQWMGHLLKKHAHLEFRNSVWGLVDPLQETRSFLSRSNILYFFLLCK